jgi:hypothetical protein
MKGSSPGVTIRSVPIGAPYDVANISARPPEVSELPVERVQSAAASCTANSFAVISSLSSVAF